MTATKKTNNILQLSCKPRPQKKVGDYAVVSVALGSFQGKVTYVLDDGQVVLDVPHPVWNGEFVKGFPV